MKTQLSLFIALTFLSIGAFAQKKTAQRQLTVEPGIGFHINFGTDVLITNLVQWNPAPRVSVAAHSSYNINNVTQREFNFVTTEYNYSVNQKFGVGTNVYGKHSSHSFLIMAGAKYTAFKETLHHPDLNTVSTTVSAWSPDYGAMYSLKRGVKNMFFSFRFYIPLYPWPTKGSDINYIDANRDNVALEAGIGIKLR